jgi:hypothetical protein
MRFQQGSGFCAENPAFGLISDVFFWQLRALESGFGQK